MYFNKIPKIAYLLNPASAQEQNQFVVLTDITRNVRFKSEVIDNIVLYDYYILRDTETIEQLSEKLYGTPQYHWVLMMLNGIYDYRSDLPMSQTIFEAYIKEKYGSIAAAKSLIAFYTNSLGHAVDFDYVDPIDGTIAKPVSAYDTEEILNEGKRKIKVISPELMSLVIKNYEEIYAS